MIVMPSNQTGIEMGYLAGRYPGKLGHLFSPGAQRGPFPHLSMTYALDNGAWPAFASGHPWKPEPWLELVKWSRDSGCRPSWVLVPDAVGDREATLGMWSCWADIARSYAPLAFAAQDGMTPSDVPPIAEVVFLGGSTEWKWSHLFEWCQAFPRVHVGRVNGLRGLRLCAQAGAESCDGTGFGRTRAQWTELHRFLSEQAGEVSIDAQTSWLLESTADATEPGLSSCGIGAPDAHGDGR